MSGPYVFLIHRAASGKYACKAQQGCRKVYLPGGRLGANRSLEQQVFEQGWRIVELGEEIARDPYGADGTDEVIWREARLAQRSHFVGKFYPVWGTADDINRHDWIHEDVLEEYENGR